MVRVEHTDGGSGIGTAEGVVAIRSELDAGKNVRPRGEDVRAGDVVLRAGEVLRAPALTPLRGRAVLWRRHAE